MTSRVYFVQGESGGPIKIGTSQNVSQRLETLQSGCPIKLVLLAHRAGDRDLEQSLHLVVAEHRLHGEWFAPAEPVLAEVRRALLEPQDLPEPAGPDPVRGDPVRDERLRRFLSISFKAVLLMEFGQDREAIKVIADCFQANPKTVSNWLDCENLPHSLTLLVGAASNPVVCFWLKATAAAAALADYAGIDEFDAYGVFCSNPQAADQVLFRKHDYDLPAVFDALLANYPAIIVKHEPLSLAGAR